MRLISLRLRNFKGLRSFSLDARGGNVVVRGENATGKTSIADAFAYVLFDKDSTGRKDFSIKTIDPADGQPIHGLEHEVEAELDMEPGVLTLKKVYSEVWQKPRGQADKVLTGHTTQHFLDSVPVDKGRYDARIAEICPEDVFRLLTDPGFFNLQLPWKRRRELLLEVCGNVSVQEVAASDKALAALPGILGSRTLDDHRAVIDAQRKQLQKNLKELPVRISEVERGLPAVEGDREGLQADIGRLRTARQGYEAEKVRIQAGGEVAERTKRLREIEGEILRIQHDARAAVDKAINEDRAELTGINGQVDAKRREIRSLQGEIQAGNQETARHEIRLTALRVQWREIDGRVYEHSQADTCPACGQALPQEEWQAAQDKAWAEFNTRKAQALEENVAEGRRLKARVQELEEANRRRDESIERAEESILALQAKADEIQNRIGFQLSEAPDVSEIPEHGRLAAEKAQVEQDIASLRTGNAEALERVAGEIRLCDQAIAALEGAIGTMDQRTKGLARIDDLKADERRLAGELEALEAQLFLMERFELAQAEMLQERINARFQGVKFRMFNRLINGGIEPACVAMVDGVPYETGLNTAGQINAGLEIIDLLSRHVGLSAPVWVDRRESVVRLFPTRAQVISLVVSAPDKALRVECESAPVAVATRKAG